MARMGRISVRIENDLKKKIKKFAEREDVTTADFCRRLFQYAAEEYERVLDLVMFRRLFRWASEEYERVGHIEMLRRMSREKEKTVRRGKETK
jgi:antitoxin component of RelBE/YafQ-DinJ toxin-antitoxin module